MNLDGLGNDIYRDGGFYQEGIVALVVIKKYGFKISYLHKTYWFYPWARILKC